MRFMRAGTLKRLLGIPQSVRFDRAKAAQILPICKDAIIVARRKGDDASAATLSQAKEFLKRRAAGPNCCPGTSLRQCGVVIGRKATHCRTCTVALRVPVAPGLPVPVAQSRGRGRKIENPAGLVRAMELAGGNVQVARRMTGADQATLLNHAGHVRGGQRRTQAIPTARIIAIEEKFGAVAASEILGVDRKTIYRRKKRARKAETHHAE